MNDELMERLARALANSQARDDEGEYERLADLIGFSGENKLWTVLRTAVQAILSELSAAGFVVVPEVPTEEMVDIGTDILCERGCNPVSDDAVAVFSAMLRARPKI